MTLKTNFFQICELLSFISCGYFFGLGNILSGLFMFVTGVFLAVFAGELMRIDSIREYNNTIEKEVKQYGNVNTAN